MANQTKMNELEIKLLALEQQNFFLIEKIKNNEKNFEIQMNKMAIYNESEKESRLRVERYFNMLNEQVLIYFI